MSKKAHRNKKSKKNNRPPKGSYPAPGGGYYTEHVTPADDKGRRIRVRGLHRADPDPARIAEVVIALAVQMLSTKEKRR